MFVSTNHVNFLTNPHASLEELGDTEDFVNDISDDDELNDDMNLDST